MGLPEVLPLLRELSRDEKLQVMRLLEAELDEPEATAYLKDAHYPVWSPIGAVEAASAMLAVLSEDDEGQRA